MRKHGIQWLLLGLALITVAGCASLQKKIFSGMVGFERGRAEVTVKTVQTDNRVTAYMERPGAPEGETIVLLHGFSANKDNWIRFIRYIPEDYRVLAVDMPGHGDSTQNMAERYAVSDIVRRLTAALDQLSLKRFHLAGNSLGGLVATHYTLNHPEKVLTLGLFNAAGVKSPVESKLHKMAAEGDNFLLPQTEEEFYRLMDFTFSDQPFLPWPARPVLAREYIDNYVFNKKMWQDIHSRQEEMDLSHRLGELTTPTLILWGDQDNLLHVSSVGIFEALLPDHETVVFENCGHIPMMERPKDTAAYYLRFIQQKQGE